MLTDPSNDPESKPIPENDLATPEGDNERPRDEPLSGGVPTPTRPRGDEPHTDEPLYPTAY